MDNNNQNKDGENNPEVKRGDFDLGGLSDVTEEQLDDLRTIRSDLNVKQGDFFRRLASKEGFKLPEQVGEDLNLENLNWGALQAIFEENERIMSAMPKAPDPIDWDIAIPEPMQAFQDQDKCFEIDVNSYDKVRYRR